MDFSESSAILRGVQSASSEEDAETTANSGITRMKNALTTMRDGVECFHKDDRDYAEKSLASWSDSQMFANIMACYYLAQRGEVTPELCQFKE
ncbi:hypothetical protein Aph01nite_59450 [Acrocarpospora phusangensis]|uniref:Uncharacterized protein n=1 Tax=Acrocarpospora phusangensis TaxID=1070424 RepID=A0A919UTQ6_9ACTN|nr:hypothetical protein [Acrocarpospora phusangensis]GIH27635.1 hypothetical protein Aph01nite_59450 [Acrocarpospora phusangensis]